MEEIRAHKTITRVAIYWEGEGEYFYIANLNIYAKIKCKEIKDFEQKKGSKIITIKEEQTIKF